VHQALQLLLWLLLLWQWQQRRRGGWRLRRVRRVGERPQQRPLG
jgi:hypothetical protein